MKVPMFDFSNRQLRRGVAIATSSILAVGFIAAAGSADGFKRSKAAFNDGSVWQADGSRNEVGQVKLDLDVPGASLSLGDTGKSLIEVEQSRGVVGVLDRGTGKLHLLDDRKIAKLASFEVPDAGDALVRATTEGLVVASGKTGEVRFIGASALATTQSLDAAPVLPGAVPAAEPVEMEVSVDGLILVYGLKSGRLSIFKSNGRLDESIKLPGADGLPADLGMVGATPLVLRRSSGVLLVVGKKGNAIRQLSSGNWRLAMPSVDSPFVVVADPEGSHVKVDLSSGSVSPLDFTVGPQPIRPLVDANGLIVGASEATGEVSRLSATGKKSSPEKLKGNHLQGRLVWGRPYVDDLTSDQGVGFDSKGNAQLLKSAAPEDAVTNGGDSGRNGGRSQQQKQSDKPGSAAGSQNRKPQMNDDNDLRARPDRATILQVLANDRDPDGDPLMVTELAEPPAQADLSIAPNGAAVVLTPKPGFSGSVSFRYVATDPSGLSGTASATVDITADGNSPPVAVADETTARVGRPVLLNVLENDRDPDGDSLQVAGVTSTDGDIGSTTNGFVSFTPTAAGKSRLQYKVSDERGATSEGEVTVGVSEATENQSPILRPDLFAVGMVPTVLDVLANDIDPDGSPLSITRFRSDIGVAQIEQVGTKLRLIPSRTGVAQFSYQASDGESLAETTVRVDVRTAPGNRPPIALPDRVTVVEGGSGVVDVLANDSDPDGDVLAITSWNVTSGLVKVQPFDSRRLQFTADGASDLPVPVTYTVSDGTNRVTSTVLVSIVAKPNEGAAPIARDDVASVRKGVGRLLAVLANDVDPDGGTLKAVVLDGAPAGVSLSTDGKTVVVEPSASSGAIGSTIVFGYTVQDETGKESQAKVRLAVVAQEGTNTPPVANVDRAVANEGRPAMVAVIANDSDLEGDQLSIVSVGQPSKGSIKQIGTQLRYTASTGQTGTDRFIYTVDDGHGGTSNADVEIGILPKAELNRAPVAKDDGPVVVSAGESSVSIDVLANDTDPDGDGLTITGVENPSTGKLTVAGGRLRFVPPRSVKDPVQLSLRYTVADPSLATASAVLRLNVTPSKGGGKPPIARPDTVGPLAPGESKVVNVLANDEDPDGPTSELVVTGSSSGAVSSDKRSIRVTAGDKTEVIRYKVTDAEGLAASGSVELKVSKDRPPQAADDAAVSNGEEINIDVLGNDIDPEGKQLTLKSVSGSSAGTASVEAARVRFRPNASGSGEVNLNYVVADPAGNTATGAIRITVNKAGTPSGKQAPTAKRGSLRVSAGRQAQIDLARLATDKDSPSLTFAASASIPGVTVTVNGSNLVLNAEVGAPSGSGSISFSATDADGLSASSFVVVTVTGSKPGTAAPNTVNTRGPVAGPVPRVATTIAGGASVTTSREPTTTAKPKPGRPSAPSGTADGLKINFKWPAVASATAYEVELERSGSTEVPVASFETGELQAGKEYRARVRAKRDDVEGDWSDFSGTVKIVDRPSAPKNASGKVTAKSKVTVTWEIESDGGSPIEGGSVTCEGGGTTFTGAQTRMMFDARMCQCADVPCTNVPCTNVPYEQQ